MGEFQKPPHNILKIQKSPLMEKDQELEWAEAQKIAISVDLVAAAKQLLRFLAEIDRNRSLYDGHALDRAIYR
ncbi:hypothetical protein QQP08_022476 [Theobroma cacao]|nr:hypothetical protein QQP08_022476 [Theobroma cacao]